MSKISLHPSYLLHRLKQYWTFYVRTANIFYWACPGVVILGYDKNFRNYTDWLLYFKIIELGTDHHCKSNDILLHELN